MHVGAWVQQSALPFSNRNSKSVARRRIWDGPFEARVSQDAKACWTSLWRREEVDTKRKQYENLWNISMHETNMRIRAIDIYPYLVAYEHVCICAYEGHATTFTSYLSLPRQRIRSRCRSWCPRGRTEWACGRRRAWTCRWCGQPYRLYAWPTRQQGLSQCFWQQWQRTVRS